MLELRVPVLPVDTEVLCADGRRLQGQVYLPTAASSHPGPMRPDEWMNQPAQFFPFQADGEDLPVILNKQEVLSVTVGPLPPADEESDDLPLRRRRVLIDQEHASVEGMMVIDLPESRGRVLDQVNAPGQFLTILQEEKTCLVNKNCIMRIREIPEA